MIRTSTQQTAESIERTAQLVCDACGFASASVDIGSADTARAVALRDVRKRTGFVEVGPKPWLTPTAPAGIGEAVVQDFCARCAEKKGIGK